MITVNTTQLAPLNLPNSLDSLVCNGPRSLGYRHTETKVSHAERTASRFRMNALLIPLIQVTYIALDLYLWVIIISVIMSWLVAFKVVNTHNRFVHMVGSALHAITEPALRRIRRFLPVMGGIDFSPIVPHPDYLFLPAGAPKVGSTIGMTADRRSYCRTGPDGLVMTLRVTPKASRTAIAGPMETEDGVALKVAITTTPDKGKANAAVTALFVKAFGVAKRGCNPPIRSRRPPQDYTCGR